VTERWLPVVGFPQYEVSDHGRVRSKRGLLKLTPHKIYGYVYVWLGKPAKGRRVHQLVLGAFVGPCPPGQEGCHGPDMDKTNNRLTNLRWDTHLSNMAEVDLSGQRNGAAKITDEETADVAVRYLNGEKSAALAREFSISQDRVTQIARAARAAA
jgi:hypothetical protein